MKFKMAEKSLFAILLRSPWWISFGIALGFGLAAKALLPAEYVVFGALGGFPFVVVGESSSYLCRRGDWIHQHGSGRLRSRTEVRSARHDHEAR